MLPSCLRLADDVFPRVRAHAVRRLVDAGWSQSRAGGAVGLSQAMVSKLLAAPPASDPLVERLAEEFAAEALQGATSAAQPSPWCVTLTTAGQRAGADTALQDILAAERLLVAQPPLRAMPQVGLNVAVALRDSAGPDDVLAFPGRIVEASGRLVRPAPPAFGGSGHLARVLLALRARWPDVSAVANVRGGADVEGAARKLGWRTLKAQRHPTDTGESALHGAIAAASRAPQAMHDPGAIGLEPCLYILGADAGSVARAILALDTALEVA